MEEKWTDKISYYEEKDLADSVKSLEKKMGRALRYLKQVRKDVSSVIILANKEPEETEEVLKLQDDAISVFQNLHQLGDMLARLINKSLNLGYNDGDSFYYSNIVEKIENLNSPIYNELLEKIKGFRYSDEFLQVTFISNIEKHVRCLDFGLSSKGNYCLNVKHKLFEDNGLKEEEVKAILSDFGLPVNNKNVKGILQSLSKIKFVGIPNDIAVMQQEIFQHINQVGNELYEVIKASETNEEEN